MFLAVPKRFGIALNLDAVPILPLDADDVNSFAFRDIGRLDGGRELSIASDFNEISRTFEVFVLFASTWKRHRFLQLRSDDEFVCVATL